MSFDEKDDAAAQRMRSRIQSAVSKISAALRGRPLSTEEEAALIYGEPMADYREAFLAKRFSPAALVSAVQWIETPYLSLHGVKKAADEARLYTAMGARDRDCWIEPEPASAADYEKAASLLEGLDAIQSADPSGIGIRGAAQCYPVNREWLGPFTHGLNVVAGKKGVGKSQFLIQSVLGILRGEAEVFGFGVTCDPKEDDPRRALLIFSELDQGAFAARLAAIGKAGADRLDVAFGWPKGDKAVEAIEKAIAYRRYSIVAVDMLQSILPEGVDSNSYETGYFYNALRRMAQRTRAAIIATWHAGKGERADFVDSLMGSTALAAQSDTILLLSRARGSPSAKIQFASNHAAEREMAAVVSESGLWGIQNPGEPALSPSDRDLLKTLAAEPEALSAAALATRTGRTPGAVRASLSRLQLAEMVKKEEGLWSAQRTGPHKTAQPVRAETAPESAQGAHTPLGVCACACAKDGEEEAER